ncbi:hypothetical protein RB195_021535 [Necator americanus]|uniref:Methyltransferase-like protein 13 n=1 Tax=Necator americanus TaxID=51031 RepID=A0ABR1EBI1_NECAM
MKEETRHSIKGLMIKMQLVDFLAYKYARNQKDIPSSIHEKSESRKTKDIKNAILKQKERTVGTFCPSIPLEPCFTILDKPSLEDDNLVVIRYLKSADAPEITLTTAELETPQELTWKNFNTKHWPVNKLVVRNLYTRLMIAMGFIMEALEFDPHQWQNVLVLGLGGGSMSNFLSFVDFVMVNVTSVEISDSMVEIAREWFGLAESDTNTVVVQDALVFVHNAVKRGEKYKSILLDACLNERQPIICPIPEFRESNTIQDIANILDDEGDYGYVET